MSDVHYFSNGSEHERFEDAWCERCERDQVFRSFGAGGGCVHALNLVSMVADPVFVRSPEGALTCTAFLPVGEQT